MSSSDSITGYTVSKLTPSIQVTQSVPAPVGGQPVSFTGTVTVSGTPVTSGTVQWSVGGTAVGGPVAVGPDGTAPLGPLTDLAVGSDQVGVAYSGTDQVATGSGTDNVVVGRRRHRRGLPDQHRPDQAQGDGHRHQGRGYLLPPGPAAITCIASDNLSGLAGHCTLTVTRGPARIIWKATATDKAGNLATVTGTATLTDYYVAGVPRVDGFYQVKSGHSYMVKAFVITTGAPRYVFAAPRGEQPHPVGPAMTKISQDLWAIEINVTAKMRHYKYWTLGVRVGGVLHTIAIELNN